MGKFGSQALFWCAAACVATVASAAADGAAAPDSAAAQATASESSAGEHGAGKQDASEQSAGKQNVSAQTVMDCMRANLPERLHLRELELRNRNAEGESSPVHRARVYLQRKDGRASMTSYIDAPGSMRGTAYLWRELESRDETFIYIPALNRVRRVIGSGADAGVLDSEFSMRDLQQAQGAFSSGQQELLGEDTLDERPVWRMRFTPGAAEPTPYLHVEAIVDQQSCVTLQAGFVDGKGVAKRYRAEPESLETVDGLHFATRVHMNNLRNDRSSVATLRALELPEDLPLRVFMPNAFYQGR